MFSFLQKNKPKSSPPPTPQLQNESCCNQLQNESCCNHSHTEPIRDGYIQEVTFGEASLPREIVGAVVTMCSGSTYDGVFNSIEQKAGEGERVAVYRCLDVPPTRLLEAIQGGHTDDIVMQKMLSEIASLEPGTVVFNWECCSGFSGDKFGEKKVAKEATSVPIEQLYSTDPDDYCKSRLDHATIKNATVILMAHLLEKGFMVQCCDFSAGALINCWDDQYLGSNPFVKAGTFDSEVTLMFDSTFLKQNEDSAQLQMVGELCDGVAKLHAMAGTVAFTLKERVKPSKWDTVEVLTVATSLGGRSASEFGQPCCSTKSGLNGMAGHAIVKYPTGGRLLVGCPHWIELSKVNVTEDHLVDVAAKRYGEDYATKMRTKLETSAPGSASRAEMCNNYGGEFIKQSAPQRYAKSSKWNANK